MGPLGKIAAFFSSNTSLHNSCSNNNATGPSAKELKKAANAAQLAIKRRNRRNEWYYGEAGVPPEERRAALAELAAAPMGGSSEDVRSKFSRRNPVWSSLRDLRSGRRNNVHADIPRNIKKVDDAEVVSVRKIVEFVPPQRIIPPAPQQVADDEPPTRPVPEPVSVTKARPQPAQQDSHTSARRPCPASAAEQVKSTAARTGNVSENSTSGPSSGAAPPSGPPSEAAPPSGPSSEAVAPSGPSSKAAPPSGPSSEAVAPSGPSSKAAPPSGPSSKAAPPSGPSSKAAPPSGPSSEAAPPSGPSSKAAPPSGPSSEAVAPSGPSSKAAPPSGPPSEATSPEKQGAVVTENSSLKEVPPSNGTAVGETVPNRTLLACEAASIVQVAPSSKSLSASSSLAVIPSAPAVPGSSPPQLVDLARSPCLDLKHRRPTSGQHQQQQHHHRKQQQQHKVADHNGRVQLEPVAKQNGVSTAPLPARRTLTASLRTSPGPNAAPQAPQGPTPEEVAAEVRKRLLPDLRHNATAVEAMSVLLDYTTNKLGAFAAPALRRDLEKIKSDMANTVIQLEEAREQHCRLAEERAEQEKKMSEAQSRQEEAQRRLDGHEEELQSTHAVELAALRGQMDSRAVEATDAVAVATRGLREEYEMELDRVTRRHEETLRAALGAAQVDAERESVQRTQEAARREAEMAAQLKATEAAHEALREQSRRVMDSMKSDKDARTQALAARCRELQDEVDSLRSVLELRCDELQKSRRENDALRIAADQLPGAEQRISTLTARLEDLQVQLDRKGELESKLLMDNSELQQSFSKEIKEKQMLSLQNEQLQFKLKQNTEVVNALAANMSDFHDVSAILNASVINLSQDRGRRNSKAGQNHSNNNTTRGAPSPPESPRVKGVVEKSESVSYMLEMDTDTADDVVARIYRRMASTPVSSPSHHGSPQAHPRSAPPTARRSMPATPKQSNPLSLSASATTIPATVSPSRTTAKQRNATSAAAAAARVRSRSTSSDSGECLSSGNWSPPASLPHQQQQLMAAETDGLLAPPSSGYDCSDIEDFSSSKSSSMSCSSEGSELTGLALGMPIPCPESGEQAGHQDADHHQQDPPQGAQELDLDLMTASCGSLGGSNSVKLPMDAGGEAMICTEEMADDVNGINSSEEDGSCSGSDLEDEQGQGVHGPARLAGPPRPHLSLPMTPMTPMTPTGGCGQSAINTPIMDSSWSEDMELPVSLSET